MIRRPNPQRATRTDKSNFAFSVSNIPTHNTHTLQTFSEQTISRQTTQANNNTKSDIGIYGSLCITQAVIPYTFDARGPQTVK